MLTVAVVLNVVSALGLCALAAKYGFGPAPADYHLKIMGLARGELGAGQTTVFKAVYRVLGAAFLGLAIALASISLFGIAADLLWAKLAVLCVGLAAGLPIFGATYAVYRKTGVETPWKPTVAILVLTILAFVASVL